MLEGRYLLFCDSLDDVIKIRKQCSTNIELDHNDTEAIHVIVYEDNIPIACGRMLMNETHFTFDNILVIEEKRHAKVGDFVLRLLIEKADLMCADKVYIQSNKQSIDFFLKFGFEENKSDNMQYDLVLDITNYMKSRTCCK